MGGWVAEMQAMLDNLRKAGSQEKPLRRTKPSIYKVPPFISKRNKEAYQPQVVSFGPYHHGEPQLAWMEAHKERALVHCIHRSRLTVKEIFDFVAEVAQKLKDSYDSLDSIWQHNTEGFVRLMILDGCFMLEVLHVYETEEYYSHDDPVFSRHGDMYVMHLIRADMLMLENQLPMLLLLKLKLILENDEEPTLPLLLLGPDPDKFPKMDECWHVLDLYRKGLLQTAPPQSANAANQGEVEYPKMGKYLHKLLLYCKRILHPLNKPGDAAPQSQNQEGRDKKAGHNVVRPATELHEAGVHFMESKSKSLRDITFDVKRGVLTLPNFSVEDHTESMLLNLIAFERCHATSSNDITSFVAFMDCLIDDNRDIKLLSSKGIIENYIGTDKEAADLFNKISKDLLLWNYNLYPVYKGLIDYSKMFWPKHRANLTQTYFRNPWAIFSVIAAFLLFSLTAVQTIFTILN